jgi:cation transport regulator ChaB
MPQDDIELPSTLEKSADKIQRTYEETLQSAEEQYDDEARAHRTAWASVKHVAEKRGDHWELKDEPGPSGPRSE